MAVVGPRNGTAGPYRNSKSCLGVRNGLKWGDYMSCHDAAPERDQTSNVADDEVLRYTGDGWEGCVVVVHQVGACEEGRCRYFSLNALGHVWVQ